MNLNNVVTRYAMYYCDELYMYVTLLTLLTLSCDVYSYYVYGNSNRDIDNEKQKQPCFLTVTDPLWWCVHLHWKTLMWELLLVMWLPSVYLYDSRYAFLIIITIWEALPSMPFDCIGRTFLYYCIQEILLLCDDDRLPSVKNKMEDGRQNLFIVMKTVILTSGNWKP